MKSFYLTKRAFTDIKKIYEYSQGKWGKNKADEYMKALYSNFNKITNSIELGELRKNRCIPFLMYPSGRHYIVYEPFKEGVIIITLIHQVRNIENIIQEFGSTFYNEIEELKANIPK